MYMRRIVVIRNLTVANGNAGLIFTELGMAVGMMICHVEINGVFRAEHLSVMH